MLDHWNLGLYVKQWLESLHSMVFVLRSELLHVCCETVTVSSIAAEAILLCVVHGIIKSRAQTNLCIFVRCINRSTKKNVPNPRVNLPKSSENSNETFR